MLVTISAIILLVILLGLTLFQIALALGKPYGNYAWGGTHTVLPTRLRVSSAISVLLYSYFAIIIADAAGWINVFDSQLYILLFAIYSTLGIFLNGISRSKKEQKVMTPIVTIMAICGWILVIN